MLDRGAVMAIPWLAALQMVPWGQVIEHAPKVLAKAQELLRRRQAATDPAPGDGAIEPWSPAAGADPAQLRERLDRLQTRVEQQAQLVEQQSQMLAELAEQSANLIAAIDAQRRQLRRTRFALVTLAMLLLIVALAGRG
jgi:TolA-binding protein